MVANKPARKSPKPPLRSARNKMMDLLALRDHSEKELRKKLKDRDFSFSEIETAIEYGRAHDWLPDNDEKNQKLSEKMSTGLHRKGKGILYINHFLQQKGLPPVPQDPDLELEKALGLLENKITSVREASDRGTRLKLQAKLVRFLTTRGFTLEIIRKAIK